MKIMRFLNKTVDRSRGPPGVMTAGITGGFPFLASITELLTEEIFNENFQVKDQVKEEIESEYKIRQIGLD